MSEGERAERRARQRELADRLKASGPLDQIFEQIDAGEVPLGGDEGLLKGMLKAALERGLEVELTDHVGYERGEPDASLFPNSHNGTTAKTVSSEIGDVELAVPRDRNGTFTPQLIPKGARRLGGLDEMIISLYAGGMTLRDIQHHLVSTIGTELSHETISKITDQVAEEVLVWQRRPLEALYPVIYLDALVVKVKDAAHVRNKAAHIAVGVDMDGIKHVLGIWVQTSEGAKFWAGVRARAGQPRRQGCADRLLRRAHRLPGGDRGDLAAFDSPNLCGASDPGGDAVRQLARPQDCRRGAETDLPSRRRRRGADRIGGVPGLRVGPQEPSHRRHLRQRLGMLHPVFGVPAGSAESSTPRMKLSTSCSGVGVQMIR